MSAYTRIKRWVGRCAIAGAVGTALAGCGAAAVAPRMAAVRAHVGHGIRTKAIDGGASYFADKSPRAAWMDRHILLGAWLEQPIDAVEVGYDNRMGDNMYWNLPGTAGKDRADYNVIRAGGMHVAAPDATRNSGSETVAYEGSDEADMDFGPGGNPWRNDNIYNSSACEPAGSQCGYTAAAFYYTGRPATDGTLDHPIASAIVHQGYGKGVLFWESGRQAAKFLRYSDILSADSYWNTDSDLQSPSQGGCALLPHSPVACGGGSGSGLTYAQSHLPANYAFDVTELEQEQMLNGRSKPVVVDVETGCPFSSGNDAGHCATPAATVAAAWHALIAGARGIIWFQHDFSGPCVDLRTFIDGSNPRSSQYSCQQTPGVTLHDMVSAISAFNHRVASLNEVLLSPTLLGYVTTPGDVSILAKAYGGNCYVVAGAGRPASPPPADEVVSFRIAHRYSGPITVLGEGRALQAEHGVFSDSFADADSVHVYRFAGGGICARQAP